MSINIDAILNIAKVNIPDIGAQLTRGIDATALSTIESSFRKILGPATQLISALSTTDKRLKTAKDAATSLGNVLQTVFREGGANSFDVRPALKSITQLHTAIKQLGGASNARELSNLEIRINRLGDRIKSQLGGSPQAKSFVDQLIDETKLNQGIKTIKNATKSIKDNALDLENSEKRSADTRRRISDHRVDSLQQAFVKESLAEQKAEAVKRKAAEVRKRERQRERSETAKATEFGTRRQRSFVIATGKSEDKGAIFQADRDIASQRSVESQVRRTEKQRQNLLFETQREYLKLIALIERANRAGIQGTDLNLLRSVASQRKTFVDTEGREGVGTRGQLTPRTRVPRSDINDPSITSGLESSVRQSAADAEAQRRARRAEAEAQRRDAEVATNAARRQRNFIASTGVREDRGEVAQANRDIAAQRSVELQTRRTEGQRRKLLIDTQKEYLKLIALIARADKSGIQGTDLELLRSVARQRGTFFDTGGRQGVGARGQLSPRTRVSEFDINSAGTVLGLEAVVKQSTAAAIALGRGANAAQDFGNRTGLALKRYSAFVLATAGFYRVVTAFRVGTQEALKYEKILTSIVQVTDKTRQQVLGLSENIRDQSRIFGVASSDIAEGLNIFAQAGFTNIADLQNLAQQLSKIPLAATFDDIRSTSEGLLAIFGQFNKTAADTAYILDLVNEFAAQFAIESRDIFEIVKRGGAAFATAGGSLEEFIQLASVLRESTRIGAETIGTFFKTATAQLLSPNSQKQLRNLGVTSGNVVDQLTQLSKVFFDLDEAQRVNTASNITGQRQYANLIAILRELQDPDIQKRLQKTQSGVFGSLDRDIGSRADDINFNLNRLKTNFNDFIVALTQDDNIRSFVKEITNLSIAFIGLLKTLTPLAPLLTTVGAALLVRPAQGFLRGLGSQFGLSGASGLLAAPSNAPRGFLAGIGSQSGRQSRGARLRSNVSSGARRFVSTPRGVGAAGIIAGVGAGIAGEAIGGRTGAALSGAALGAVGASFVAPAAGPFAPLVIAAGAATGALIGLATAANDLKSSQLQQSLSTAKTFEDVIKANVKNLDAPTIKRRDLSFFEEFFLPKHVRFALPDLEKPIPKAERDTAIVSDLFKDIKKSTDFTEAPDIKDRGQALQRSIGQLFTDAETDILFQIRTSEKADFDLIAVENEIYANVSQKIVDAYSKLGIDVSIEEIGVSLGNLVGDKLIDGVNIKLVDLAIKARQDIDSISGLNFTLLGSTLQVSIVNLFDKLVSVIDDTSRQTDRLNTIITDVNAPIKVNLPTQNIDLLKSLGLDSIDRFEEQTRGFSKTLQDLIGSPARLAVLAVVLDDVLSDTENTTSTFDFLVTRLKILPKEAQKAADVLEQLAAETADTSDSSLDLLKSLVESGVGVESFVKSLRGNTEDLFAALGESLRSQFTIFETQRDLTNSLNASLRTLNQTLFDSQQGIKKLSEDLQDRLIDQQLFESQSTGLEASRAKAEALSSRTGSQFGDIPNFIQTITQALNQRSALVQAAGQSRSTDQIDLQHLQTLQDLDVAQRRVTDLQQELSNRLTELNFRISNASSAADLLKQSFDNFDSDLKGAGASISQLTVKELGRAFVALKTFATKGLGGLGGNQLQSIQKLLTSLGEIPLGGGQTGASIVGDINREFGIVAASIVRSILSGGSRESAEAAIRQELATLQAQQKSASDVEKKLREDQIKLQQAQLQFIVSEEQLLQDQLSELRNVHVNVVDKLTEIINLINALFGKGTGSQTQPPVPDISIVPTPPTPVFPTSPTNLPTLSRPVPTIIPPNVPIKLTPGGIPIGPDGRSLPGSFPTPTFPDNLPQRVPFDKKPDLSPPNFPSIPPNISPNFGLPTLPKIPSSIPLEFPADFPDVPSKEPFRVPDLFKVPFDINPELPSKDFPADFPNRNFQKKLIDLPKDFPNISPKLLDSRSIPKVFDNGTKDSVEKVSAIHDYVSTIPAILSDIHTQLQDSTSNILNRPPKLPLDRSIEKIPAIDNPASDPIYITPPKFRSPLFKQPESPLVQPIPKLTIDPILDKLIEKLKEYINDSTFLKVPNRFGIKDLSQKPISESPDDSSITNSLDVLFRLLKVPTKPLVNPVFPQIPKRDVDSTNPQFRKLPLRLDPDRSGEAIRQEATPKLQLGESLRQQVIPPGFSSLEPQIPVRLPPVPPSDFGLPQFPEIPSRRIRTDFPADFPPDLKLPSFPKTPLQLPSGLPSDLESPRFLQIPPRRIPTDFPADFPPDFVPLDFSNTPFSIPSLDKIPRPPQRIRTDFPADFPADFSPSFPPELKNRLRETKDLGTNILPQQTKVTDTKTITVNLDSTNALLNNTNESLSKLQGICSEILKAINNSVDKLINSLIPNGENTAATRIISTLEIKPIQVNVALTAPDILKLAGNQIYQSIIRKISPAIAQALGVSSDEARNIFESNLPKEL
jgi:hypothetical protein